MTSPSMNTAPTSPTSPASPPLSMADKPTVLLMVGMAGSGKTTFMQRITSHIQSLQSTTQADNPSRVYTMNLDPAVTHVPYPVNIDIRETVDYKQVMDQFHLGPNGGILTSLNLFTTRFGQALDLVEKKHDQLDYVLLDTPGQIEIFTWSASGAILTESLAATYRTVLVYLVDTPRCTSPTTFMSNMLYACSILYKTRLPFVLVFNKSDVVDSAFAQEWMTDFEAFQEAMQKDTTYMGSLVQSMGLLLEEFYEHLRVVGCSAYTGQGIPDFFDKVQDAVEEYDRDYLPQLQARIDSQQQAKQQHLQRLLKDMNLSKVEDVPEK